MKRRYFYLVQCKDEKMRLSTMVTLLDSNLIPAQETLGLCELSYNAFIIIIINNINAKNKDFSRQFHSHRQSNILIRNENPRFYLGLRFKKA